MRIWSSVIAPYCPRSLVRIMNLAAFLTSLGVVSISLRSSRCRLPLPGAFPQGLFLPAHHNFILKLHLTGAITLHQEENCGRTLIGSYTSVCEICRALSVPSKRRLWLYRIVQARISTVLYIPQELVQMVMKQLRHRFVLGL